MSGRRPVGTARRGESGRGVAIDASLMGSSITGEDTGDTMQIVAYASTTTTLPAYTYANGSSGVGATLTANANGAFPTIDGVTLVANDSSAGIFHFHHGASASDNGLYLLTAQGSLGTPWVATRLTSCDSASEIAQSKIRILNGIQKRGAEYSYVSPAAITVGTTPLFWKRTDARMDLNEGVRIFEDCAYNILPAAGTSAMMPSGLVLLCNGTGNTVTADTTNSASIRGVFSWACGTTATARSGIQDAWVAATTQPDGGGAIIPATNVGFEVRFRVQVPVLSTALQEFAHNHGLAKQAANSQKTPADGIVFIYDRTSVVSTTKWLASVTSGGIGTPVDTGITVNAGQFYELRIVKDAGSDSARFYIDHALVSTQSIAGGLTSTLLGFLSIAFKNVGTTTTNTLKTDWVAAEYDFPTGRAA